MSCYFRYMEEILRSAGVEITKENKKDILPEHQSGFYRKVPVAVVNGYGRVIFQPPPVNRITTLMKDSISWLNSDQAQELYPVLLSGISHYEFVRIHPFIDGNGRTA